LILSSSLIQRAPPLLDPCSVGEDLGRRKQCRAATMGGEGDQPRGSARGGQVWGKGGGWWPRREKGKKGWPPRVLWEKETTPQMTSDFASNGPQPFPSSTHQNQLLVNIFLGYYTLPPLKRIHPRFRPLQAKHPRYPI
jgi:hypothetical protein